MFWWGNMFFAVTVCAITAILVLICVLFKPDIKIGKVKFATYWVVSLIGALVLLLSGCIPVSELLAGLTADSSVNPIKILILFFSMTSLSVFLDVLGFFRYLANIVLSKANGSQKTLFTLLYITVSVLTVFTSNDIVILTFTPFICFFSKKAKINPMPYLIAEFVAANTWSMALIIGNPTNIYLASFADIDFINYFKYMAIPTLMAGLTSYFVLYFLFRKQLSQDVQVSCGNDKIRDKKLVVVGLVHLVLCTIFLTISSYIGLPMWLISFGFALSLFLCVILVYIKRRKNPKVLYRTFVRLPFELVPFVLSMFTLVLTLDYIGATKIIAGFLVPFNSVFTFGFLSVFVANIINNIPMSVFFSSVLNNTGLMGADYLRAVFASVAGSNIGAYLTPVGALAGIMWSSILKIYGIKLSFKDFVKNGLIIAIPTLLMTLIGIEIVL